MFRFSRDLLLQFELFLLCVHVLGCTCLIGADADFVAQFDEEYDERTVEHTRRKAATGTQAPSISVGNGSAEVINYVCQSPPRTTGKAAHNDTGRCSAAEAGDFVFCSAQYVARRDLQRCNKQLASKSAPAYCTLLIPLIFHLERQQAKRLSKAKALRNGNEKLAVNAPQCKGRTQLLQLGQRVIQDCGLEDTRSASCQTPSGGCSLALKTESCSWKWMARVALLGLSRDFRTSPASAADPWRAGNFPCWEPELRAASGLRAAGGRWDVDDACVDVVRTMAASALRCTVASVATRLRRGNRRGLVPPMLAQLQRVYEANAAHLMRHSFGEVFARFKETARRRRQRGDGGSSSAAAVSCSGLRRAMPEARATAVRLTRLALVENMRHERYSAQRLAAVSLFSMMLPCCMVTTGR